MNSEDLNGIKTVFSGSKFQRCCQWRARGPQHSPLYGVVRSQTFCSKHTTSRKDLLIAFNNALT